MVKNKIRVNFHRHRGDMVGNLSEEQKENMLYDCILLIYDLKIKFNNLKSYIF